jgi:hypothetical protein
MDYSNRLILALIAGVGIALGINYFFGNLIYWLIPSLAIAFAAETALRTSKETKKSMPQISSSKPDLPLDQEQLPPQKPPKPNF